MNSNFCQTEESRSLKQRLIALDKVSQPVTDSTPSNRSSEESYALLNDKSPLRTPNPKLSTCMLKSAQRCKQAGPSLNLQQTRRQHEIVDKPSSTRNTKPLNVVSNLVSPSRSNFARHVKPLFANRPKNSQKRQAQPSIDHSLTLQMKSYRDRVSADQTVKNDFGQAKVTQKEKDFDLIELDRNILNSTLANKVHQQQVIGPFKQQKHPILDEYRNERISGQQDDDSCEVTPMDSMESAAQVPPFKRISVISQAQPTSSAKISHGRTLTGTSQHTANPSQAAHQYNKTENLISPRPYAHKSLFNDSKAQKNSNKNLLQPEKSQIAMKALACSQLNRYKSPIQGNKSQSRRTLLNPQNRLGSNGSSSGRTVNGSKGTLKAQVTSLASQRPQKKKSHEYLQKRNVNGGASMFLSNPYKGIDLCQKKEDIKTISGINTKEAKRSTVSSLRSQARIEQRPKEKAVSLTQNFVKYGSLANSKSPVPRFNYNTRNTGQSSLDGYQNRTDHSSNLLQRRKPVSKNDRQQSARTNNQVTLYKDTKTTGPTQHSFSRSQNGKPPLLFQHNKTISGAGEQIQIHSLANFVQTHRSIESTSALNQECTKQGAQESNQILLESDFPLSHRTPNTTLGQPETAAVKVMKANQGKSVSKTLLKKRRSQGDISARSHITQRVESKARPIIPSKNLITTQCKMSTVAGSTLKKSKSQTRMLRKPLMNEKKISIDKLDASAIPEDRFEAVQGHPNDMVNIHMPSKEGSQTRINILSTANNFGECRYDSNPNDFRVIRNEAQKDTTPLSETVFQMCSGIMSSKQSMASLMVPCKASPHSKASKAAFTSKSSGDDRLTKAQTASRKTMTHTAKSRPTTSQRSDSTFGLQNLSQKPMSYDQDYTEGIEKQGFNEEQNASKFTALRQSHETISPCRKQELQNNMNEPFKYVKRSARKKCPSLDIQNLQVFQQQKVAEISPEAFQEDVDQLRLKFDQVNPAISQQTDFTQNRNQAQNVTSPTNVTGDQTGRSNRRKRSQRTRTNRAQDTIGEAYGQAQKTPIVSLTLDCSDQSKTTETVVFLAAKVEHSDQEIVNGESSELASEKCAQSDSDQLCFYRNSIQLRTSNHQSQGVTDHETQTGQTAMLIEELEQAKNTEKDQEYCLIKNKLNTDVPTHNFSGLNYQNPNGQFNHKIESSFIEQQQPQIKALASFYPQGMLQIDVGEGEYPDQRNFDDRLEVRDLQASTKSKEQSFDHLNLLMPTVETVNPVYSSRNQITPLHIELYGQAQNHMEEKVEILDASFDGQTMSKPSIKADQLFLFPTNLQQKSLDGSKKTDRSKAFLSPAGQRLMTNSSRNGAQVNRILFKKDCASLSGAVTALAKQQKPKPDSSSRDQWDYSTHTKSMARLKPQSHSKTKQKNTARQSNLTKSHSQINTRTLNAPKTPQKQNLAQNNIRNAHDAMSCHKSPGARSGCSYQPKMYAKKSTKKLTHFEQFALTPSSKEGGGFNHTFISPIKLKKLERRHGVCLTGRNQPATVRAQMPSQVLVEKSHEDEETEEEGYSLRSKRRDEPLVGIGLTEKHQTLLQDNDAMDAYMKNLCEKYF